MSNADRVVFPDVGITKGDVVAYYEVVADTMLAHLAGRPLTLERYPRGIAAPGFMQKNAADHFPASIQRVEVPKRDGTTTYPVVTEAPDLAYLANQGTITFHVWSSRIGNLDRPDRLIIDLDPSEGDIEGVRRAARIVGPLLAQLGLASIPVATGSKGYHVVVPIHPTLDGDEVAEAMNGLAVWLAHAHPDLLTTEFRKEGRKGRVFVDWLRNRPGQTTVVPWSLRARPGAPAAVPLEWDELENIAPDAYGLRSIAHRLGRADPLTALATQPSNADRACAEIPRMLDEAGIRMEQFDRFRS